MTISSSVEDGDETAGAQGCLLVCVLVAAIGLAATVSWKAAGVAVLIGVALLLLPYLASSATGYSRTQLSILCAIAAVALAIGAIIYGGNHSLDKMDVDTPPTDQERIEKYCSEDAPPEVSPSDCADAIDVLRGN